MSLTQERINEIALECIAEITYIHMGGIYFSNRSPEAIASMFNSFLSRIREEQEAIATVLVYNDAVSISASVGMLDRLMEMNGMPLFAIPPAAPDCKELVEALEMARDAIATFPLSFGYDITHLREIDSVLTKHKTSMGEK